jgi:hypothetical protein
MYQMRVVGIFHVRQAFIVNEIRNNEEAKNAMPTWPEEDRKNDRLMCAVRSMKEAREKLTREDYDMLAAHFEKTGEVPDKALEKFGKRAYFSLEEHGKNIPDEVLPFMNCQLTMNGNYEKLAKRFQRGPVIYFIANASNVDVIASTLRTKRGAFGIEVTASLIGEALKEKIKDTHFIFRKGKGYQNNLSSEIMDQLLPPRQDGEGAWPGCREIYRFWVHPTEPDDDVKGVILTLELGPGPIRGNKQANLESLPKESRDNMIRIGGKPFENWQPDGRIKKFQFDIQKEECDTTLDAVQKAVGKLLEGLAKWQNNPICKG